MSCADGYDGQASGCSACGKPCLAREIAELLAAAEGLLEVLAPDELDWYAAEVQRLRRALAAGSNLDPSTL